MTWTHCHGCPSPQDCAEADDCARDWNAARVPLPSRAELKARGLLDSWKGPTRDDYRTKPKPVRRLIAIGFRSFWRAFWRSAGWCIPIILALEWWARHK